MPVGTVKKLANAINHLGTGDQDDPLAKRAANQTHGYFRGCYLVCESDQKAKYEFLQERNNPAAYHNKTIVEYDGKLMRCSDAMKLPNYDANKVHSIDGDVCPDDGHERYSAQDFANRVCPQFGANATSGEGCAIAPSLCTGNAVATPASSGTSATLGAIAVVPIFGGLLALGLGAWALYKYCIKRDASKVFPSDGHAPPKRMDAKLQLEVQNLE